MTTKAKKSYHTVDFQRGDFLFFGKETAGLPENLLQKNEQHTITVPMVENARSLNLSNTVALVLYEALRQNEFRFKLQR